MAAALLAGGRADKLKMGDTSLETLESGLDTSQTTDCVSDDDDDELLALRIAALESIKLKESRAQAAQPQHERSEEKQRPDFVIKSHPKRSNLLSIVTCEEELVSPAPAGPASPPPVPAFFDPTRPPPGWGTRLSPPPPRSRYNSRSPPRRWSRSPPPPRRRSVSPFRRRRSFSRSPGRRSPPPRRSRTPPRRRSPTPPPARRSPSPSEWETDTESEPEPEKEEKKETETDVKKPDNKESTDAHKSPPTVNTEKSVDESADDVLIFDAGAEVDEFSAFLNEFEDEVLDKKETVKKEEPKKEKKERPETEKKVVDGKRLRKKIKPKKATPSPPPSRTPSPRYSRVRGSRSPGRTRSPGHRYFSPGRGKVSPRRRGRSPSPARLNNRQQRSTPDLMKGGKPSERSSKSKEKTLKDTKVETESAVARAEREQREYEERLKKLPTPERERLEARKKKFDKQIDVKAQPKKISLKTSKSELSLSTKSKKNGDSKPASSDSAVSVAAEVKKSNVTDLRVQLHKKRKAAGESPGRGTGPAGRNPLLRSASRSPSPQPESEPAGQRRRVVPPGAAVKSRLKVSVRNAAAEEESDRSPSPPARLASKRRKTSGESVGSAGEGAGLGGRRILVLRKERNREKSPEEEEEVSPKREMKKSLHMRLGGKVEQFTENEILAEMLRQQEEKRKEKKLRREIKELKKREKLERKDKKKSKKKRTALSDDELSDRGNKDDDSDEELYRFFEDKDSSPSPEPKKKKKKRNSSGREGRVSSGEKRRLVLSSETGAGKPRSRPVEKEDWGGDRRSGRDAKKRKSEDVLDKESDAESLDIVEKMKRKSERRLRRMREIEQDKLMFA